MKCFPLQHYKQNYKSRHFLVLIMVSLPSNGIVTKTDSYPAVFELYHILILVGHDLQSAGLKPATPPVQHGLARPHW